VRCLGRQALRLCALVRMIAIGVHCRRSSWHRRYDRIGKDFV
jgi:hypothetical protein